MDKNNVRQMFDNLSDEDKKRVEDILSDQEKTRQILNTPQAQELMKRLMGER